MLQLAGALLFLWAVFSPAVVLAQEKYWEK
jgi:hypothetical protein